jgi:hypothetical protein
MDQIVLTRLLSSSCERAARAAQERIADGLDHFAQAAFYADLVAREQARQARRERIAAVVLGLAAVVWAGALLVALCVLPRSPGMPVFAAAFLAPRLLQIACVQVWNRWVRSPLLLRAALALARCGDLRALVPLLGYSFCRTNGSFGSVPDAHRQAACAALAPLLDNVHPTTPTVRCRPLSAPGSIRRSPGSIRSPSGRTTKARWCAGDAFRLWPAIRKQTRRSR